jgi:hypothetical protein
MLAPEPNDPGRIMAALEKFNPKGRGPLVAAVKEAAAALGRAPGPASLVVIHDDLDNCSQDPCIAAEEIARSNPGLAIVVSLALAKQTPARGVHAADLGVAISTSPTPPRSAMRSTTRCGSAMSTHGRQRLLRRRRLPLPRPLRRPRSRIPDRRG